MSRFIPTLPVSAPFTPEQRAWINGFLAAIVAESGEETQQAEPMKKRPLLILWGSQTGTAEALARKVANSARTQNFEPRVVDLAAHTSVDLTGEENLLVVTSTYGDGEPPDNARSFWQFLQNPSAPRLERVAFGVLALGDTNYEAFCQFGKLVDERLEQLGGRRILPRTDCDTDYEAPANAWMNAVFSALGSAESIPDSTTQPAILQFGRSNPFPASVRTNRLLSGSGSAKEVRHFEIALGDSGLSYEPGDALGLHPSNCPALVSQLLDHLQCDGEEAVQVPGGEEISLRSALIGHFDIARVTAEALRAIASQTGHSELLALTEDAARKEELKQWMQGRDLLDVLHLTGARLVPGQLVSLLKRIQPRLYSISSSMKAHPGEVHLTVGIVRYESRGRSRKGVASCFLADRSGDPAKVPVYIQSSHGFKLPADSGTPVIMVGPGTGVAPFRAFLEERRAIGAAGKNWLFFGDQRRATDFLYREELERMAADGVLTRLDTAFSRDQPEKIYVQNRMLEQAPELWRWLEDGAHFYVCGDASRMAKDVDAALHRICEVAGGLSPDAATAYVEALRAAKRYARDVY